jgi:hypothetical protein
MHEFGSWNAEAGKKKNERLMAFGLRNDREMIQSLPYRLAKFRL